MPPQCIVVGCRRKGSIGEKVKCFRIPKPAGLRKKWLYLCGNSNAHPEGRVCERHFSLKQHVDPNEPIRQGRRTLKPGAVPDRNLPVLHIPEVFVKREDTTSTKLTNSTPATTMTPSLKKCVPLSVKLKILDDQEKGFGPKKIMKKYKVKKSTYYRILSEKEMIRDYVDRGGSLEYNSKVEKEEDDQEGDAVENNDPKDKVSEIKPEGDVKVNCDREEPLNQAVMDWYNEQKAEGVPVDEVDINGAAERLARELGFTHFKLNSGWPLRFRKPQSTVDSTLSSAENSDGDEDSNYSGSSGIKGMKVLRIQDQITAFQRVQAGETAGQVADDMGVSRQTIQRIKKKFKDTLQSPTMDEKYHISVEKTKYKNDSAVKDILDTERNKESVFAAIERRKRLKLSKKVLAKKDQGLSYQEKIEAVAQCKAGVSLKQIARDFCVSTSTIQRVKKKFSESHQLQFKHYMRLDQKVRVLERLDEGETIMEIAEDLGVHETTVRGIKKSRLKIMSLYRAGRKFVNASTPTTTTTNTTTATTARAPTTTKAPTTKAPKVNKYETLEKKLMEWINNLRHWNIPMSNSMIQKKALMIQMHLAQDEGISTVPSFLPTKEWLAGFKRRNNIQKLSPEDTDSASEPDELRFSSKAAPKSKKKYFAAKRKAQAAPPITPEDIPLPPAITEIDMPLSKFAEGLREMYLSRSLPPNPYRCNAFTPRVLLTCSEPRFMASDIVKTELLSDEETWLTAHTNAGSDSDWTEQNWDANSLTEISNGSRETQRSKRKNSNNEFDRKRRRVAENESDEDGSVVDYSRNNYMNIPIKQEPQSSVDSISPNVPMAVLPAGSTYVPPLPMFQMPNGGLTVFMPESQQMMMQHPVNYPHNNASDLFMNQQQQQLRGRANDINASGQFSDIHSEVDVEPSIRQDNENMIVMPFGRDADGEAEKSNQLPSSEPDSVSDALAEKARKERAAAIAENIGMNVECSSNKKLRDLTFKLLELNGKNLICDDRIDKAREEYEKTVAHIEAEKRINDTEIDKVLSAIQEWKEAKSNNTTNTNTATAT
ncbi:uncharacterized protein LOC126981820 isoform X2 [Eriocheir sinensis]|nr:uncharacterized protein LOC126981820 isoform X2 [Eriocheir sinensis]XP_050689367.1 uncharacterized protein LOC126981820 isoform X2 [Eriocheir sinensis]XP_050689373.1 uncharacterized protein LOC126981820 isoform X2 [Eriocheir sinensis]